MSPKVSRKPARQTYLTESLSDFAGGLDTRLAPNRIKANEATVGASVYADNAALLSRNGTTTTALTVDSTTAAVTYSPYDLVDVFFPTNSSGTTPAASNSETLFLAGVASVSNFLTSIKYTLDGSTFSDVTYKVGTITTNSASAVVTGSGTAWLTAIRAGDLLQISSGNARAVVQSVDSDTQITLTAPFGSTVVGSTYNILMIFPDITGTLTTNRLRTFVASNRAYFVPSGGWSSGLVARYFDGGSIGFATAIPLAKFFVNMKNYTFALNTSATTKSRVNWSALKAPETYPASNFVDVSPDDGQDIVGGFTDGTSLIILKRNSAYRLTGDVFDPANPSYTLTKISTPADFFADNARTAAFHRGVWVFRGSFDLYKWDGATITKIPESERIAPTIRSLTNTAFNNPPPGVIQMANTWNSQFTEPTAISYKGDYIFTGQYSTTVLTIVAPKTGLIWDRNGAFWQDPYGGSDTVGNGVLGFTSLSYFKDGLYGVTGGNAGLYKLDVSGTTSPGLWASKEMEFDRQQHFALCWVYFKKQSAGSMALMYSIDNGTFTEVAIDMTVGTGTRLKSAIINIGQVGSTIQFKLKNYTGTSAPTSGFEVYGIEFQRRPLAV